MRKYDINVCKCGVIHAIPNEKIEKALKKQKPLLTICGNCGVASLRGGDEDVDFDGNPCYMMYRRDFTYNDSESINKDNIDQYSEKKNILYIPIIKGRKTEYKKLDFTDYKKYGEGDKITEDILKPIKSEIINPICNIFQKLNSEETKAIYESYYPELESIYDGLENWKKVYDKAAKSDFDFGNKEGARRKEAVLLSIMFGILTVFGLVMVGLYDVKKTVVEEHESSITVDDILYNEKDKKVYINKIDDKTEVIDSEKFFENVAIVYDKESAKVVKKSYKLWFITSDEYYVSITKDMYKDIVE